VDGECVSIDGIFDNQVFTCNDILDLQSCLADPEEQGPFQDWSTQTNYCQSKVTGLEVVRALYNETCNEYMTCTIGGGSKGRDWYHSILRAEKHQEGYNRNQTFANKIDDMGEKCTTPGGSKLEGDSCTITCDYDTPGWWNDNSNKYGEVCTSDCAGDTVNCADSSIDHNARVLTNVNTFNPVIETVGYNGAAIRVWDGEVPDKSQMSWEFLSNVSVGELKNYLTKSSGDKDQGALTDAKYKHNDDRKRLTGTHVFTGTCSTATPKSTYDLESCIDVGSTEVSICPTDQTFPDLSTSY
jgi:hypothetical protein